MHESISNRNRCDPTDCVGSNGREVQSNNRRNGATTFGGGHPYAVHGKFMAGGRSILQRVRGRMWLDGNNTTGWTVAGVETGMSCVHLSRGRPSARTSSNTLRGSSSCNTLSDDPHPKL